MNKLNVYCQYLSKFVIFNNEKSLIYFDIESVTITRFISCCSVEDVLCTFTLLYVNAKYGLKCSYYFSKTPNTTSLWGTWCEKSWALLLMRNVPLNCWRFPRTRGLSSSSRSEWVCFPCVWYSLLCSNSLKLMYCVHLNLSCRSRRGAR